MVPRSAFLAFAFYRATAIAPQNSAGLGLAEGGPRSVASTVIFFGGPGAGYGFPSGTALFNFSSGKCDAANEIRRVAFLFHCGITLIYIFISYFETAQ